MRLKPPPGKKFVGEWKGFRVRSLSEMRNGAGSLPPGTIYTVESAGGIGLHLRSDPCPHCGFRQSVTHVSDESVEVVTT